MLLSLFFACTAVNISSKRAGLSDDVRGESARQVI